MFFSSRHFVIELLNYLSEYRRRDITSFSFIISALFSFKCKILLRQFKVIEMDGQQKINVCTLSQSTRGLTEMYFYILSDVRSKISRLRKNCLEAKNTSSLIHEISECLQNCFFFLS